MTDADILQKLTHILRDLLGDNTIELTRETKRADVPRWDSFNYVNFIVAVEMEYAISFNVGDIEAFEKIGDIIDQIKVLKG